METKKQIKIGEKEYILLLPTIRLSNDGDVEYSKSYMDGIKNGLKPRMVLEREYKKNGIWGEEEDNSIREMESSLQELLISIRSRTSDGEKKEAYASFLVQKLEYERLLSQKQALYQHSTESKAEISKITFLLWQCVVNADGTKLWNSMDEFLDEREGTLVSKLVEAYISFLSGVDTIQPAIEKLLNPLVETKEVEVETPVVIEEEKKVE